MIARDVIDAVQEYVNAWTWEERQAVVERQWSLLLGDDADRVMQHLLSQYAANHDVVASLTEQRAVLARCRQVGIGAAFNPYLHPERDSLSPALLERLRTVEGEKESVELLAKQPTLRRMLVLAIQAFMGTPTLPGKRAILEQEQALLLTPAAEFTIGTLAAQAAGDDGAVLAWHRSILASARSAGIDAAFDAVIAREQGDVAVNADARGQGVESEEAGPPQAVQDILAELVQGDSRLASVRVIELCREGLRLLGSCSDTPLAAFFHEKLAGCLLDDRGPNRGGSIELAIEHFTQARALVRDVGLPRAEANIIQGLATAVADRRLGSIDENKRHAAQLCEEGLQLLSDDDPLETRTLRAHLHFAAAQASDEGGPARRHAESALDLMDPETQARDWAAAHMILGRLKSRQGGYDAAASHFEAVETVFTAWEHPEDFAILQDEIATALMALEGPGRSEALELAIKRLGAGLGALSQVRHAHLYSTLSMDLGSAYLSRLEDDAADNVEKAIEALHAALQGLPPEEYPDEWAGVHLRLGKAYRRRLVGQEAKNLAAARSSYETALTVFTPEAWPDEWASAHVELGMVATLSWNADRGALDEAIREFKLALDWLSCDDDPESWAFAHANLSEAYRLRSKEHPGDRALAREHLLEATEVWTQAEAPAQWSQLQYGLGKLHAEVAGASDLDYKIALVCFNAALDVVDTNDDERISILAAVAELQAGASKWGEALSACREASELAGARLRSAYTVGARRQIVRHLARAHEIAAYSLVRLGRPGDGLVWLDGARSTLLLDELTFGIDLDRLDAAQREELDRAKRAIARLETEQALPIGYRERRGDAELGRLLAVARADLTRAQDRLQADQRAEPRRDECAVLAAVPVGEVLVEMAMGKAGGVIFVVPGGIDRVGPEHVMPIAAEVGGRIDGLTGHFLDAYRSMLLDRISIDEWDSVLTETAHELWEALIGPLHARLQELGVARDSLVALVPGGPLAMLPLHAAHPRGSAARTFLDDFGVAYGPSAKLLQVCRERAREVARAGRRVTIVSNPTLDLTHATCESHAVAAMAGSEWVTRLEGQAANRAAVSAAVPGTTYLHFACHGYNNWLQSDFSGLILAGDRPFTATEIMSTLDLRNARLVTLSACETAVRDLGFANELLGLPAAFLRAGSPGVVATLWSVSDDATGPLMERFYKGLMHDLLPPAEALRKAQCWLRDVTAGELGMDHLPPYSRPFRGIHNWGAFILIGA